MSAKRFIDKIDFNNNGGREQHYLKALSIAHAGSWELNLDEGYMWGSDEAVKIYGLNPGENKLPIKLVQSIPLPEYRPLLNEALSRLVNNNEPYEIEFKIKRLNDGQIRHIYSWAELSGEDGKEIGKIIGVIQDITERKQSEEALLENERKYTRLFESIQDVFFESSVDGTIIDVSPSISILSHGQFTRNDLLGQSMYRFYENPDDRNTFITVIKKKGSVSDLEIKLRNKDGSIITCSISAQLQNNSKGVPESIFGSIHDITHRKQVEEALDRSKKEFQNYFDSGAVAMSVTNVDRRWIQVNQKFCQILGYTREEMIGEQWDKYTYPEDTEKNLNLFARACEGKIDSYQLDKRMIRGDGKLVYITLSVVCERNPDNSPHHFIASYIDITERKRFEEELFKAKEKAEESDRLKTAFLHNISHEIRTPLNAIMGFATLLEGESDASARKSYVEVITQSSDHLISIISDIVDIANIEADLVSVKKESFNLNSMLKSVHHQYLTKAKLKNLQFTLNIGMEDSMAEIITDKVKLNQILMNLVNNAIKFTSEGKVEFACRVRDKLLEFKVSDTGIGIPEEHQPRIFERFYQVHSQITRSYEGTGLGLAICKAYADMLGGTINLSSAPGAGSTFVLLLPYESAIIDDTLNARLTGAVSFRFEKKKKILVAEDVDSNFQLINYFLKGINAEVIRAVNGKEAVEICMADKDIDFIVMDLKMPVMDGYTATRVLRDNRVNIPILAQTAYADERENTLKLGFNGFISKPFDRAGLIKALNEIL
jgi:PAS domain S-box-containing protein